MIFHSLILCLFLIRVLRVFSKLETFLDFQGFRGFDVLSIFFSFNKISFVYNIVQFSNITGHNVKFDRWAIYIGNRQKKGKNFRTALFECPWRCHTFLFCTVTGERRIRKKQILSNGRIELTIYKWKMKTAIMKLLRA